MLSKSSIEICSLMCWKVFTQHKQICAGKKLPQGSRAHQLCGDDYLVLMVVTITHFSSTWVYAVCMYILT